MAKAKKSPIERLVDFLDDEVEGTPYEWGLKLDVCNESNWGIEVRITLNPHSNGPDISTVFLLGSDSAETCAEEIQPYLYKFFKTLEKPNGHQAEKTGSLSATSG